MILKFNKLDVQKLITVTKTAGEHKTLYEQVTGPGLWLVGDDGVYLMSNCKPAFMRTPEKQFVVYAEDLDPEKVDFDTWWDKKNEAFGGDDGVEFIPLEDIDNERVLGGEWVEIDVTPQSIAVLIAA